jgi:uncharacterized protein
MRMAPRVGLNFMAEPDFRVAAMPLLDEGLVDALEWDLDEPWLGGDHDRTIAPWATRVLDVYADDDALYGHGVWFSLLTARLHPRQERWLARLAEECKTRHYRHVSEHFGWMTSGSFACNTMFPVPFTKAAVAVGVDRLRRLADAAQRPVGLENSAAVLCRADALEQGAFLESLLAPVDGFLLLDVHNVWTAAHNLGLDAFELLASFPLARVREIHVSGGDWYPVGSPAQRAARVPGRRGGLPRATRADARHARDAGALAAGLPRAARAGRRDLRERRARGGGIVNDPELAAFQEALAELLARGLSVDEVVRTLATDPAFEAHRAYVTSFEPRLIEVQLALCKRWASRT